MEQQSGSTVAERLAAFVGEWSVAADFPGAPPMDTSGTVTFEPMEGGAFLIQRWDVPPPAPSGIAIIGPDAGGEGFLQHYFDARGVARVYAMSFDGRVWKLTRDEPDFSELSFRQRWTGELSDDGRTIRGAWEKTGDDGEWEHDFVLTYAKRA